MADMEATGVSKSIPLELAGGERILIVKNPVSDPGGEVLYDESTPAGKTLTGQVSVCGELKDEV